MKLDNIQEVCDYLNIYNTELLSRQDENSPIEGKRVKIPIYTSKWKRNIIQRLKEWQSIGDKKVMCEKTIYLFNFSKFIPPDKWRKYNVGAKYSLAFPDFFQDAGPFWIGHLFFSFYQEDLQFGTKPISILNKTFPSIVDYWNMIIVYKDNGKIFTFKKEEFDKIPRNELLDLISTTKNNSALREKWRQYEII